MRDRLLRDTMNDPLQCAGAMEKEGLWSKSKPILSFRRLMQTVEAGKAVERADIDASIAVMKRAVYQPDLTKEHEATLIEISDRLGKIITLPYYKTSKADPRWEVLCGESGRALAEAKVPLDDMIEGVAEKEANWLLWDTFAEVGGEDPAIRQNLAAPAKTPEHLA